MITTPPQKVTTKSPVPPPVISKQPDRDVTRRERLDPVFAEVASPPPVPEEEPSMSDEEKAAMMQGMQIGLDHFSRLRRMSKNERDQYIIDFQREKGVILTPQMLGAFDAFIWD